MEGGHGITRVFIFVIFLNGVYPREICFERYILEICPSPIFVKRNKPVSIKITCRLPRGVLCSIKIGIAREEKNETVYYYTVQKEKGNTTGYVTGSGSFSPDSPTTWSETQNSLTLTLASASVSDLRPAWVCSQHFKRQRNNEDAFRKDSTYIQAIPFPDNTTLTAIPTRGTYSSDSNITLHCTTHPSFNFDDTSHRQLQTIFEYLEEEQWKMVLPTKGTEFGVVRASAPVADGDFLSVTYSVNLTVSSIPGCARQYRCLQSREARMFVSEATYIVINVQACTGNCMPAAICNPLNFTDTTPQGGDGGSGGNEDDGGDGGLAAAVRSEGFVVAMSVIVGSTFLLLLVVIFLFIKRRKKRNRQLLEGRRASQIPRQSITLRPAPVIADGVSVSEASSYYSSAPSSVYTHDGPTHSVTSDLTSMSSTNIDINPPYQYR